MPLSHFRCFQLMLSHIIINILSFIGISHWLLIRLPPPRRRQPLRWLRYFDFFFPFFAALRFFCHDANIAAAFAFHAFHVFFAIFSFHISRAYFRFAFRHFHALFSLAISYCRHYAFSAITLRISPFRYCLPMIYYFSFFTLFSPLLILRIDYARLATPSCRYFIISLIFTWLPRATFDD
jgi:hypothetical protein